MRIQLLRGTSCLFLILLAGSASGQDTAVIGPPYRFEPAVDEDWWGLEHVGAARRVFDDTTNVWRSEVVVAWMRDRNDQMDSPARTVRLGFSGDAGTTWTFQDFQSPISIHEYDPMAAFDPVTESLYVGSMAGGQRDYISRLDAEDHLLAEFGELQRLFSGSTQAHRPSAGAGPKPGALTESRVYVSAYFDLKWSDDLGAQASWKGPIAVGQGIQSWAVPRIGNAGELYLAHRFGIGENAHVRLDRSTSLDADTDETPLFLAETVVATTDGNLDPTWLASNLRLTDVVGCAVAPHDGKRVYVVWMDKTSEADNGCGATNHNIDLYFSMTTDATVANPTWTTKKIVPAGVEVPGDQFYPWLEATTYQDGTETNTRLHLVWYDSRQMPDQCDTGATDNSFWFDAYYAYSDDEGATWNESRLTEDSMNTIHSLETFDRVTNFYGDYIGMAVVGKRAFPLYSIATSIDEPPSDPLGWSEVYTNMIVFGNVPSYTDFTITEGTLQSADDLSLITSSNNQRLIVKDFIAPLGQPLRTIVDVELDTLYTGVDGDDEIDIRVEGHAIEANATGRIYLRPQPAVEWVLWQQFAVPAGSDADHFIRGIPAIYTDGLNLRDFVDSNGRIDVRIEMTRPLDERIGLTSHYDFVQVVVVDN